MSYSAGFGDPNQLAQRITSNIQKITQCSAEIQRILHQLGTPQDTPELRQQLQQKQQYTNQLAKETDKYIKEFGSLPATSEQRQRKIQKDRLVGEFTTALTNFQRLQRQAAEKEKDFVARVRASSRVSSGAPEDSYKEGTLVSWDSQPQAQVQDEEITEDDLRLIEERESSIRQLEADIMDINEIFKDLGMMIHEQGDVIDSIEANVENADVHVQQANQQLSRAANYQVPKEDMHPHYYTCCWSIASWNHHMVIYLISLWRKHCNWYLNYERKFLVMVRSL
ncbi:PREDICTED: syntaxin-7 isoform X1 [Haliaeetus leucocephalus]|uniref:syntaxin-7 isoform X1 n=1 Tax=Haliaeetus leucocephalus TaxID=52644 RepID=UPI00053CD5C9|nr:PREDICTED: syntaxin-7 isoform X1 [Haliaeetus leucocephalus]